MVAIQGVVQIPNLPAATALAGNEQWEIVQGGLSKRVTPSQLAQYVAVSAQLSLVTATPPLQLAGDVLSLDTVPVTLGGTGATAITGTGLNVLSLSPSITTPTLSNPVLVGSMTKNGYATMPWINVQADYQCTLNGITDDLTNFNLAVAQFNLQGGILFIPKGTLKLSAKPTAFTAIGIVMGAGNGATYIAAAYNADDIFRVSNQFTSIRDLSFQPSVLRTSGYDIVFTQGTGYRNSVQNVTHLYGAGGVKILGAAGVTLIDCSMFNMIGDTGVYIGGAVSGPSSGVYIINCTLGNTQPAAFTGFRAWANTTLFNAGEVTIVGGYAWLCMVTGTTAGAGGLTLPSASYNTWATTNVTSGTAEFRALSDDDMTWVRQDSYGNSVAMQACPLLGGMYGYAMTDTALTGTSYPNWLFADDIECDHQIEGGVRADGGKGLTLSNCWFGSGLRGNGVWTTGLYLGETTIQGCHFLAMGSTGVWLGAGVDTVIDGNLFLANSSFLPGTFPGIYVAPAISKFNITSNIFGSHVGVGVNWQYCGVLIDVGASNNYVVTDNNAFDVSSGICIVDGGTGLTKMVRNNLPLQAGTPLSALEGGTGLSALGTGVATALGINVGSAGAFVTFNGALGTPSSGTLTNATGLPISTGVSGLAAGVATFLGTPSSANLRTAVTDETGTGALVFGTSPTISTQLTLTGGTISADAPVLTATQTWNNGAVAFTGWKLNVTNTASAAGARLLDIQVGGTGAFFVEASGQGVGTFYRDQNNNSILAVTNPNSGASATALLRLTSNADFVDLYVSDNLNLAQITGGGGATQFNRAFTTHAWTTGAGTQQARLTTDGLRVGATASVATSTLTVEGSLATAAVVTKTADFTLAATESSIINNKSGSGCVMTSSPGSFPGRHLWVQNNQAQTLTSAASNVVPKGGGAAATAILPATATAWALLISNGTNWVIMMSGT